MVAIGLEQQRRSRRRTLRIGRVEAILQVRTLQSNGQGPCQSRNSGIQAPGSQADGFPDNPREMASRTGHLLRARIREVLQIIQLGSLNLDQISAGVDGRPGVGHDFELSRGGDTQAGLLWCEGQGPPFLCRSRTSFAN